MFFIEQSTGLTVMIGPILDSAGVAVTGAVIGDIKISKAGGAPAALNGAATLAHSHTGNYRLSFNAADTNTIGFLTVTLDKTTDSMQQRHFYIVPTSTSAAFRNGTPWDANVASMGDNTLTAAAAAADFGAEIAGTVEAAIVNEGDATATLAAIQAKLLELLDNSGDPAIGVIAAAVWTYSTRVLTAGTNLSIPTAADNADAVWDELQAEHTVSGSFGEVVVGSGGGDATAANQTTILAKLNQGPPTYQSPLQGQVLTVQRGKDYSSTGATRPSWTKAVLTGQWISATGVFRYVQSGSVVAAGALAISESGGTLSVFLALTSAETDAMLAEVPGTYEVEITADDGTILGLDAGALVVIDKVVE